MTQSNNIRIELRFESEKGVPATVVSYVIDEVERAILDSEGNDLKEIEEQFPKMPAVALDAAKFRLQDAMGPGFLLETASTGSIVLGGAVAGLAIWILQQTLGESLKEAWDQTDLKRRLKEFLVSKIPEKRAWIAKRLNSRLRPPYLPRKWASLTRASRSQGGPAWQQEMEMDVREDTTASLIIIVIRIGPNALPPKRGELLNGH